MIFGKKKEEEEPRKRKVIERDRTFKATLKKSNKYVHWVGNQFPEDHFEVLNKSGLTDDGERKKPTSEALDYHIKHKDTGKTFWVECRFRQHYDNGRLTWTHEDQFDTIKEFRKKRGEPVFVVLAHSGFPAQPRDLFVVPLNDIENPSIAEKKLEAYKRDDPIAPFWWEGGKLK